RGRYEEEDEFESQENLQFSNIRVVNEARSVEEEIVIPRQAGKAVVTQPDLVTNHPVGCGDRVSGNGDSPLLS
ncbi:hypothetical protein A2U01_0106954, partial [Trifolium medium]|nr:hypothetical protein [Trifolium medium]